MRRSSSAFVGPEAPDYVGELLAPSRLARGGPVRARGGPAARAQVRGGAAGASARPTRWRSSASISVMLLHERFVAAPGARRPREPTRIVVGDEVAPRAAGAPADAADMRERPPPPRQPARRGGARPRRRRRSSSRAALLDVRGAAGHVAAPRARAAGSRARARRPRRRVHGQLGRLRRLAIFGTLLAGGVFVVVNPQTKEDKLAYILDDCEAAFLVTEGSIARVAGREPETASALKATICGAGAGRRRGHGRLRGPRRRRRAGSACAGDDPAGPGGADLHVGQHGQPEGRDDDPPEHGLRGGEHRPVPAPRSDDRILGLLPLAFDYGLYQLLMSVRIGADARPRALVRLSRRRSLKRLAGGAGDSLPRRADRLRDAPLHARTEPARLPTRPSA